MLELILALHMSHTTCCHIFLNNDEWIGTVSVMTNQNAGKYVMQESIYRSDVTYIPLFISDWVLFLVIT